MPVIPFDLYCRMVIESVPNDGRVWRNDLVQGLMRVNRGVREEVCKKFCQALYTDGQRGLTKFPRHGVIRKLHYHCEDGFREIMPFFEIHGDRLSELQSLTLVSDDCEETIDGHFLATLLRVSPRLSSLELSRDDGEEKEEGDLRDIAISFYRGFHSDCSVTSLTLSCHNDGWSITSDGIHGVGLLKSVKRLEIGRIMVDEDVMDNLLSLPVLAHVKIERAEDLCLATDRSTEGVRCRWKSLEIREPHVDQLLRLPIPSRGLLSIIWGASGLTYPIEDGSLQAFQAFERAVHLVRRVCPREHPFLLRYVVDGDFPIIAPEVVVPLADLLRSLFAHGNTNIPYIPNMPYIDPKFASMLEGRHVMSDILHVLEEISRIKRLMCDRGYSQLKSLEGCMLEILRADLSLGRSVASKFDVLLTNDVFVLLKTQTDLANSVFRLVDSVVRDDRAGWSAVHVDELVAYSSFVVSARMTQQYIVLYDLLARCPDLMWRKEAFSTYDTSVYRHVVACSGVPLPDRFMIECLPHVFEVMPGNAAYMSFCWLSRRRSAKAFVQSGAIHLVMRVLRDPGAVMSSRMYASATIALSTSLAKEHPFLVALAYSSDAIDGVLSFYSRRHEDWPEKSASVVCLVEAFVRSLSPNLIQRMWSASPAAKLNVAETILEIWRLDPAAAARDALDAIPPLVATLEVSCPCPLFRAVVDLLSLVDFGADWCGRIVPALTAAMDPPLYPVLPLLDKTLRVHGALAAASIHTDAFARLTRLCSSQCSCHVDSIKVVARLLELRPELRPEFEAAGGRQALLGIPTVERGEDAERVLRHFNPEEHFSFELFTRWLKIQYRLC